MFTHQPFRWRLTGVTLALAVVMGGAGQVRAQFTFGEPVNLGPVVNSSVNDGGPSISADELTLYFGSQLELWMTTRVSTSGSWQTPVKLGPTVNGADGAGHPSISADGLTLYFASSRPGGSGKADIWMTTRESTSDPWEEPVNLGAAVNSSAWDGSPDISADGLTLMFSSIKSGGIGSTNDLYMSTRARVSDPWGPAVNLGPPVNAVRPEWSPSLSTDGLTLFFTSRPCWGGGHWDLWVTTRPTLSDPWRTPRNLGPQINTELYEGGADLSADGMTLYFNSSRAGGSGGIDIWQVEVIPTCVERNGTCEPGEDCFTCPSDCFSGNSTGCGNGVCELPLDEDCLSCPSDCNGKQNGRPADRFCCGCSGENRVTCDDPRCTADEFDCSHQVVPSTCCGDGDCEGGEDSVNCGVDCGAGCDVPADCDDFDPCTNDDCVGTVCVNDPIDCDDGDACTADSCSGGDCFSDPIDCDDGDACTVDTCDPGSGCANTFPACGLSDECCGPACDPGNDPDCPCGGKNDPCTVDEDCCSLNCRPSGKCAG